MKKPDDRRGGLLGARSERPNDSHSAGEPDHVAPPHSITSSAVAISDGGMSSPSALAVFRLMASSNLVGS